MLAGLGGLFGGGGMSAFGSILSMASQFMGQDSPDVPTPPVIQPTAQTPIPDLPANPATVLTGEQQTAIEADDRRRRGQAQTKTDQYTTKLAGDVQENPLVSSVTLLGR